MMKRIFISLQIAMEQVCCFPVVDWLDVVPTNEQVAAGYWKTKEAG